MYQWLLVRRYLFSKVMPLLAVLAVLLCCAMVLVTWSVMGGFLDMLIRSGRTTTGDVTVTWPNVGFAHYDDLIARLEKDPLVEAATPVVESYALVGLPNGRNEVVFLRGVDGPGYARVTAYDSILWWRPIAQPLSKDHDREDPRLDPRLATDLAEYERAGQSLTRVNPATGQQEPAAVLGIEVSGFNRRSPAGFYDPLQYTVRKSDGATEWHDGFLPRDGSVVLNVLPIDREGRALEQASRRVPVANEFNSGLFEADSKVILVRLDLAQQMLRMNQAQRRVTKPATPEATKPAPSEDDFVTDGDSTLVTDPARVTHVLVRGKGDLSELGASKPLRERVREIYAQFAKDHEGQVPGEGDVFVLSWEDQNRTMIAAVQKETGLVLFLFSFISLVAVFLVFAIFWAMISEKTKDIGVVRALGASRVGVAGVWVAYGLAIGVVGSALGGVAAYIIVKNINPIHDWLASALDLTIWDPKVYYFSVIPSKVDPAKVAIVLVGGLLSSVLGALVPAWRAARMDPVRALRFE
jgi:lipoprotein-releasing system permease protein